MCATDNLSYRTTKPKKGKRLLSILTATNSERATAQRGIHVDMEGDRSQHGPFVPPRCRALSGGRQCGAADTKELGQSPTHEGHQYHDAESWFETRNSPRAQPLRLVAGFRNLLPAVEDYLCYVRPLTGCSAEASPSSYVDIIWRQRRRPEER